MLLAQRSPPHGGGQPGTRVTASATIRGEGFAVSVFVGLDGGATSTGPLPAVSSRSAWVAPVRQVPERTHDRLRWQRGFARAVVVGDVAAVVVAVVVYALVGSAEPVVVAEVGVFVLALSVGWLAASRAWDSTVLGQGTVEFTRLLNAVVGTAVTVGLLSLALQLPAGRPWAFGVIPLAGLLAALSRRGLRVGLHRRRRAGQAMRHVLAVGDERAVGELIARARRDPHNGLMITGVCTPAGAGTIADIPVIGDLDSVSALAGSGRYDAISVSHAPGWSSRRLQNLAWDLEGSPIELIVDPGIMEVAGPRLHIAAVDGMPLLRLTHPTFDGMSRMLKTAIDRLAALAILLATAPVMMALAVAVRLDGGPVLFRQTRVGLGGREFKMIKFRSMVVNAETLLPDMTALNEGAGPLFKMRRDPRVTPIGTFLRRFSLDELPQLFNVLGGSMSLVGPRPPLPSEVEGYARDARRRLLVKPGMTGLWQVNGRSDLSWEESVRLDVRYVENWSLALDAQILLKTIRAVLGGNGAY
jgi:exopolysaccharide biosynthesis polyprenyl glycosylphosphotransferase